MSNRQRPSVHCYLDEEDYAVLAAFSDEHGVTFTSTIAALIRWMLEPDADCDDCAELETAMAREVAVIARNLDQVNRSRRRRQPVKSFDRTQNRPPPLW